MTPEDGPETEPARFRAPAGPEPERVGHRTDAGPGLPRPGTTPATEAIPTAPPAARPFATGAQFGPGIGEAPTPPGGGAPGPAYPAVGHAPVGPTTPTHLTGPAHPDDPLAPGLHAEPPRRRRPWALVAVSVLLVAALALSGYLWQVTRAHERTNAELTQAARDIGTELAKTRAELEGTVGELEGTQSQLATAQERITALADEKAQLGDDREIQRQLVDYQERVSQAARNVASALSNCIDGQNQLITYLENAAAYDPADLERFKAEVQTVCGAATDANTQLQRELDRGTDQ
ncbi:hypothetical protein [Cellulomonas hominis]